MMSLFRFDLHQIQKKLHYRCQPDDFLHQCQRYHWCRLSHGLSNGQVA